MLIKSRCIVLRTVKYGDRSLIIDLLSREYGRMSVVWRVPKLGRGGVCRQYFQPLSILEVVCDRRSATSLPVVKETRIAVPYETLQTDSVKLCVAFFIAEFLSYATRTEQENPYLFDFVEGSLVWYDAFLVAVANFHLMFMMRVSRFLGFYPNVDDYSDGAFFDLRAGIFTPSPPVHGDFLRPDEACNIRTLMRMSASNMHLFRLSRTQRNNIVEVLLHFYSLHIPDFRPLKSWDVLKEVFD